MNNFFLGENKFTLPIRATLVGLHPHLILIAPGATINHEKSISLATFFKTAWFSKTASKAHIGEVELCTAIRQVVIGQADNLGGGVFKKRLDDNRQRSIILAKDDRFWVFVYLFAKKDRDNLDDHKLTAFKKLAGAYGGKTEAEIVLEIRNGDLLEICHDNQNQI